MKWLDNLKHIAKKLLLKSQQNFISLLIKKKFIKLIIEKHNFIKLYK